MWLARDKNGDLHLFPYDRPLKGVRTGIFYTNIINYKIEILEIDDKYKDITWENSPVELTYKL